MTIFGLDFSHYDAVPAGARVVAEGFQFMTHKAGGDANDAELAAWWKALKPYRDKVVLGAYWVLYPGNPAGRADAFLARLDSQCPGWRDGPFILQLDCEIWNGDTSTQPGKGDIKAACDRLKSKTPKLTPIVYASAGQYGSSLTGLGYPLWNARYPTNAVGTASGIYASVHGDNGSGWAVYSGEVPAIWQYSSSANAVGQSTCDVNAFRGTLNELTALVAPGWVEQDMEPIDLLQYDPNDPAKGIPNDFNDKATNKTVSVRTAIYNGYSIPKKIQDTQLPALEAKIDALAAKVDALSAQQLPADLAEQLADILAQRLSA